jgi:hypothetical protein
MTLVLPEPRRKAGLCVIAGEAENRTDLTDLTDIRPISPIGLIHPILKPP